MGFSPRNRPQQIDWIALAVVVACGLGVLTGLAVIAKYIFRSFSGG